MQFVAYFGHDAILFRLASALEQEMPRSDRIPPIHVSKLLE